MAKESSLDIFWVLNQLDSKNFNLWDQLSDEQKKDISPYVLTRWLGGTNDPEQICRLADIGCTTLFEFGNKKDLMLKILTACTVNGSKRYKWITPKGSTKQSSKILKLISDSYKMPLKHAQDVRPLFSDDDIIQLAEHHGMQPDEIKDLKKEL